MILITNVNFCDTMDPAQWKSHGRRYSQFFEEFIIKFLLNMTHWTILVNYH